MTIQQRMTRREFLGTLGRTTAGVLGAMALGGLSRAVAAGDSRRPPNVVFILVDDMGWRDLQCYGSTFHRTPHTDRLAAEGMRFTNAYAACPVCSPTRASVLTGKYPARLHLTDWIPGQPDANTKLRVPRFNQQLPLQEVTIAEVLRDAGYATASIGKWHLGGEGFYPEQQGFDLNFGGTHKGQPPRYFYPYRIPNILTGKDGEYLTDRLTDEAEAFIAQHRDHPFFLYLSHFAVHKPLQGKQEKIDTYAGRPDPEGVQTNATYAAMVESVDESVGRVLDQLRTCGLAENTLVIFTSDNGGLASVTPNTPLRAGKGTLYEGGIREPLIVRWPGTIAPGTMCDVPVSSVDFFPTILELVGVDQPRIPGLDGISLAPLLLGRGGIAHDPLYWHYPHYHGGGATPGGAIREGDWKLIEFFEDGRLELYNLRDDLGETKNLAAEMPEKAAELQHRLADWRMAVDAQMPTPNPDYRPGAPAAVGAE